VIPLSLFAGNLLNVLADPVEVVEAASSNSETEGVVSVVTSSLKGRTLLLSCILYFLVEE
jgi:hypothetical protein